MIVTAYTRASTDKQEMSVPDQLRLIGDHCRAKGYTLIHPDRYSDRGLSGTTFEKRPGVMQLIADCQAKRVQFQRIVILNETRWGRPEDEDDSTFYELTLKRAGIEIEYVQGENHAGVVGRITRSIKYSQASDFSKQLGKDVIRGSKGVVELGFSPGGSTPYGFQRMLYDAAGAPLQVLKNGEKKVLKGQKVRWIPGDYGEIAIVRRIFESALTEGLKTICKSLNDDKIESPEGGRWEATTLYYLVKNRAYIGERSYGGTKSSKRLREKTICPLAHEPIIDRALFEAAQEAMAARNFEKKATYTRSTYLLTSKLVCLKCGYNFFGKRMTRGAYLNEYYQCNGYEAHRVCSSFLIQRRPIEAFVVRAIEELVTSDTYRAALHDALAAAKKEDGDVRERERTLRNERRGLQREIDRILDELEKNSLSKALRERLRDREAKLEEVNRRFTPAVRAPHRTKTEETIEAYLKMIDGWKGLADWPIEKQKQAVALALERGEVDRERREVRFYFFALPAAHVVDWPLGELCGPEGRWRADSNR